MGKGLCDGPRLPSISQTLDIPPVSGYIVICYRLCFDEGHIANRLPEVVMMVAGFPTEYTWYNKYTSSDSTAPSWGIRVGYAVWVKVEPCQGPFNQTVWFKCKEHHCFFSLYNLVSPPIQTLFPHVSPLTLSFHLEKKYIGVQREPACSQPGLFQVAFAHSSQCLFGPSEADALNKMTTVICLCHSGSQHRLHRRSKIQC